MKHVIKLQNEGETYHFRGLRPVTSHLDVVWFEGPKVMLRIAHKRETLLNIVKYRLRRRFIPGQRFRTFIFSFGRGSSFIFGGTFIFGRGRILFMSLLLLFQILISGQLEPLLPEPLVTFRGVVAILQFHGVPPVHVVHGAPLVALKPLYFRTVRVITRSVNEEDLHVGHEDWHPHIVDLEKPEEGLGVGEEELPQLALEALIICVALLLLAEPGEAHEVRGGKKVIEEVRVYHVKMELRQEELGAEVEDDGKRRPVNLALGVKGRRLNHGHTNPRLVLHQLSHVDTRLHKKCPPSTRLSSSFTLSSTRSLLSCFINL